MYRLAECRVQTVPFCGHVNQFLTTNDGVLLTRTGHWSPPSGSTFDPDVVQSDRGSVHSVQILIAVVLRLVRILIVTFLQLFRILITTVLRFVRISIAAVLRLLRILIATMLCDLPGCKSRFYCDWPGLGCDSSGFPVDSDRHTINKTVGQPATTMYVHGSEGAERR